MGNNATPYLIAYWTVTEGPVVIGIPGGSEDVSRFCVFMESWKLNDLKVRVGVM